MSDDQESSLSGWDSLPSVDVNNEDNDLQLEPSSTAAPVVVELPSEGISNDPLFFDRKFSGTLESPAAQQQHVENISTSSSFSIVNGIDHLNLQGTSDESMSSVSAACTPSSSVSYASMISRCGSVRSSDESMMSEFEFISVSGETKKHCRNCKFNSPEASVVCEMCGSTFVANPNTSMDEQIALHLYKQDIQTAEALALEEKENKKRQRDDPLYDFSKKMAEEIRHCLFEIGVRFQGLPEQNLIVLGLNFLERANSFPTARLSLAYKVTPANALDQVKKEGFVPNSSNIMPVGGTLAVREVDVSTTIDDALLSYHHNSELLSDASALAFAAQIQSTTAPQRHGNKVVCWITAIIEFVPEVVHNKTDTTSTGTVSSTTNVLPFPAQVLPLVYFNMDKVKNYIIQPVVLRLMGVFEALFKDRPGVILGPFPPFSSKKPRTATTLKAATSATMASATEGITGATTATDVGESLLGGLSKLLSVRRFAEKSNNSKTGSSSNNNHPNSVTHVEGEDDHGRRLFRMEAGALAVAVSSRATLAEGCDDRKIYLWSDYLGHYKILVGHSDVVTSLAFSPPLFPRGNASDCERLASGDMRGVVKVWDTSNPGDETLLLTLDGEGKKPILDIRFFPSGKTVGVVDWNRDCFLWALSNGICTCKLKGNRPETRIKLTETNSWESCILQSAAFSPNGKSMASAVYDFPDIYYWKFGGTKEFLKGHESNKDTFGREQCQIRALSFSPDGTCLASASNDGTIRLWGLKNQKNKALQTVSESISCLAFSPDGNFLSSGGGDGVVRVWDVKAGLGLRSFEGHTGSIKSIAFFPDGQTIVSSGRDRTLRFWMNHSS